MMISVAERLKEHTKGRHQEAEALLLRQLSLIRTVDDYCSLLKMFYGYYSPVEQAIRAWVSPSDLHDMEERNHSSRIFRDLIASGHNPEIMPVTEHIPQIHSKEEALGAMYVLEGATLGGQYIVKMLQKMPHAHFGEHNMHFFNSYIHDTGKKWTAFVNLINQQKHPDAVIYAAVQTFSLFTQWIKQIYLHEHTPSA